MKSPINYLGKKTDLIPYIHQHAPHTMGSFVDLYMGSGVVTLSRFRWADCEIMNDKNEEVVNFWRVLRDKPKQLIRALQFTPHSRSEIKISTSKIAASSNDVIRAVYYFVRANQAFATSGRANGGWRIPTGHKDIATEWRNKIDPYSLDQLVDRLRHVSLENNPALRVIKQYDTKKTFFYADPPYLSVASHNDMDQAYQGHAMTEDDHRELIDLVLSSKGMFMISGYDHLIYKPLTDHGWHKIEIPVKAGSVNKRKNTTDTNRIEILWISPNCQPAQNALF